MFEEIGMLNLIYILPLCTHLPKHQVPTVILEPKIQAEGPS
jgi:hypothetical protein